MAQSDLYSLLRGYAVNTKSATVSVKPFLSFISQYAAKKEHQQPELSRWSSGNAEAEFKTEIAYLMENGKCNILADGDIFLPDICREIIKSAYQNPDKYAGVPFLGAANMNLKIPTGYAKTAGLLSDMEVFFGRKGSGSLTVNDDDIINLEFPQSYGTALMLASMIPRKLMEFALIKIQFFLSNGPNMAHIVNVLNSQLKDKERALKECIDRIMYRPFDCINDMERFDDFVYQFWVHFCALVKKDINAKNEIRNPDLAVLQSVYVIEVCGSLYRSSVVKKQEIEAAYAKLEELMNLPPYRYTLGDIIKFTNDKGIPLLNYYSQKELEAYIRKKITESKDGALPVWSSIQGTMEDRWFLRKDQYLPVCAKMLQDVQPAVKTALFKRWTRLVKDYLSEPAMEKDTEYEKLLKKLTNNSNPAVLTVLADPKLLWAFQEVENTLGTVPQDMRLFSHGALLPLYTLYSLRRKDVIAQIKDELPIWYSNPILLAIIKFFKSFRRKKPQANAEENEKPVVTGKQNNPMKTSALRIKSALVPEGKTIDEYIEELEDRWCSLRDGETRKNLILDVQSLMKDKLRQTIKLKKMTSIKRSDLHEIADYIINENVTLDKLDQDSLRMYMELYMLKLVLK